MHFIETYLQNTKEHMQIELEECNNKLSILPKGHLDLQYSKKGTRLYWIKNERVRGSVKRVPKRLTISDFSIAKGLRDRRFYTLKKHALETNLKWWNHLQNHFIPFDEESLLCKLKEPYKSLPGFEHFLGTEHTAVQSENPSFPQHLIHSNSIGELFRSKSEMHISELLLSMNINYRYEMKLILSGETKYPDFTIKKPGSNERKYIEYFGMLENSDYAKNTLEKINWYLTNGFVPGKNILFLFENTSSGIDLLATQNQIEMLINA